MQLDHNHNNPLPPVYKDQFNAWLRDPVTEHLFNDLKTMYADCISDPLPTISIDRLGIEALKRESWQHIIDVIFEWSPMGIDLEDE